MKTLRHVRGQLSLFLILAISVLCAVFFIVSCGNKPQQKTKDTNAGPFAIDFNRCPAGKTCTATPKGTVLNPVPDIGNKQVTLEAWIKPSVTSTTGTIFKRHDGSRGVTLNITNNMPEFTVSRELIVSVGPPRVTGTVSHTVTVSSSDKLGIGYWYHIVGVIAGAADSHPTSTSCTTTVMNEVPHLDIYINGVFKECATTWGGTGRDENGNPTPDTATAAMYADEPSNEDLGIGSASQATIDELRLWVSRRTEAEIISCSNTELGIGGVCNRGDANLAAYYRLNEGEGADVTDISGHGFNGGFEYTVAPEVFAEWEDGWVTPGAPISPAD